MQSLRSFVAIAILVSACSPAREDAGERRPNVLLVSIDTLRADRLSSYGNPRPTSPFLDRLAAAGVRFENAYVNTHGTTPSHATLLSSLYQESHRVGHAAGGEAVGEGVPLVQELFAEAGYLTIGVTGGGNVGRGFGFARGFERFDDRARSVREGTARLLELVREADGERPIFAFYHTYEVHSPYLAPESYRELFGRYESTLVPTSENLLAHVHSARRTLAPGDLDFLLAAYDAGIRYTDEHLERLLAELGELGSLERAVVAVTSDHGEEFGEHGGLLHRDHLYEELVRVPLIVAGTGVPEGVVDRRLVSSLDVAPTLAGCAGLEVPEWMAGRDLLCSGDASPAAGEDEAVFFQYSDRRYGVRAGEWKLVENADPPGLELYHLPSDPRERHDLANERRDVARELRRRLAEWRARQRPWGEAAAVELGAEERRRLEALGYLTD